MTVQVAPGVENATTGQCGAAEGLDGLRLLRGRALIRLDPAELGEHQTDGGVWVPDSAVRPRDQKIHRGTVLALGPPARQGGNLGPEIPWGCAVGDTVVFVYGVWLERQRRFDGIAFVAHSEILAVIE
jgi:Co-chaperonin GroES (HSP10)